jgi:hypothetical protein
MKKIVFCTSLILSGLIFAVYLPSYTWIVVGKHYYYFELNKIISDVSLFFPLIFFFSLLTYFMPIRVFQAWWSFAKYAIPVILVLSFIINAGLHHDPVGQWQDIFDLPMLFILYGVFAIGSLVQIIRGYLRR